MTKTTKAKSKTASALPTIPTKPKTGRPSIYSEEIVEAICLRLACGETLPAICADDGMPSESTVYNWLLDPEKSSFVERYARARALQADTFADQTIDISDDGRNDWMRKHKDGEDVYELNGEHVQRSRLRCDTRKWAASKLNPKKYGDKMVVAGDPDAPLEMRATLSALDETQLAALKEIAAKLTK